MECLEKPLEMGNHKLKGKILLYFDIIKNRSKWAIKRYFVKTMSNSKLSVQPGLVKNPLLEWPRNYRCVCGSGKKFKKCHLNGLQKNITIEDANKINKRLNQYRNK